MFKHIIDKIIYLKYTNLLSPIGLTSQAYFINEID